MTATVLTPGRPDMGADRCAHGEAKRAVCAVGDEVPAGLAPAVVRGEIGAGRAGIGAHDGVVVEEPLAASQ